MAGFGFAVAWVSGCGGGEPVDPKPTGQDCVDEVAYDGVDQDCDGADLVDVDGDGFDGVGGGGNDCDDGDASVNAAAEEVPYDGVDQDCAGGDEIDVDGDGEPAEVAGGEDCDDTDDTFHPSAPDAQGDGVDQNCDGVDGIDADADGFPAGPDHDCDDADPARNPDAAEVWYDGVDQNCDGLCDYDADSDGAVLAGTVVAEGTPCDPGGDVEAPVDCDDGDPAIGEVAITSTIPADGERGVGVLTDVMVYLSAADATAVLTLADASGAVLPGLSTIEDTVVHFTPDAPLPYGTQLLATLSYACGVETVAYETAPQPPTVDPAQLPGQTYELDVAGGAWVEPAGVGPLLAILVEPILVDVVAVDVASVDLRFVAAVNGVQDACVPTEDASAVFANPAFAADGAQLRALVDEAVVVVDDVAVDGMFGPALTDLTLTIDGRFDTRPFDGLIGGGLGATCDLFTTFGASCTACPDGTGDYCSRVRVEGIDGAGVSVDPVPRTDADIAADPLCPS